MFSNVSSFRIERGKNAVILSLVLEKVAKHSSHNLFLNLRPNVWMRQINLHSFANNVCKIHSTASFYLGDSLIDNNVTD